LPSQGIRLQGAAVAGESWAAFKWADLDRLARSSGLRRGLR